MTLCQTILNDFDTEMKATRAFLELVPLSGYKPHEKSMAIDYLATHIADMPSWFKFALESELLHMPADFKMEIMTTREALLNLFDKSVLEGRAAIHAATDEDMQKNWTFKWGDVFEMTEPRPAVVRSFLNHLIHHRAQLGVYLRLLNIPIPGVYGPSADDNWK